MKNFASTIASDIIDFYLSLKLMTNMSKNQCILFSTKNQLNKIPENERYLNIKGVKIKFSESVKTLGVTFDQDMKFKKHVNKLYGSIFNKLLYINKCRNTLNFLTRKLLVEHCALSHLNYCRDIWGFLSYEQKTQLQKLLSFGAKIVFLKSKYDHSSHLVESLKFLTPEKSSIYFLSCTAFKCINNFNNPNIPKIFNLNLKVQQEIMLSSHALAPIIFTILSYIEARNCGFNSLKIFGILKLFPNSRMIWKNIF